LKIITTPTTMKATINRKTYNTETAEKLAYWDNNCNSGDFAICQESLYKTSKGSYFLYGRGGPLSKYSESSGGNGRSGGSAIIPLAESEALEWCEEHECQDAIEEHFNHLVEDA